MFSFQFQSLLTLKRMKDFPEALSLSEECEIIPILDYILQYEIYNMNPNIGFKVENKCFILFRDQSLKVVLPEKLKTKSGSSYSTGRILFENAFQVFGQCTNHDSKPASDRLLNKLQNLWTFKNSFRLYWNYFVSFWLFAFRDSLLFSTSSLSLSDITKYPTIKQDGDEIAPQDKN